MSDSIDTLISSATALANAGNWAQAEKVWREVHRRAPNNARALFGLGMHAYQRGELPSARQWLDLLVIEAPNDMLGHLTRATLCRDQGDIAEELNCIEAALAIDPYSLPALVFKATWIERQGDIRRAASCYRNALKIAPPPSHWPESLRPQLEHALIVVDQEAQQTKTFLEKSLAPFRSALSAPSQSQWTEAIDLMSGLSKPFTSQSNQLHIPRLPAIPFYERALFPALQHLESQTEVIRQEVLTLLEQNGADFPPYIAYGSGQPVNQWRELNHSTRWSAFYLWRSGSPVEKNLKLCPQTAAIVEAMRLIDLPGLCPNVLFSVLAPHTHIPPHHGETNARLVAHLPLVIPDYCRLRVGYEERSWTMGETLIFDDTLEHEARNDSDSLRVVLIFDVWNPLLSDAERRMVQAMTTAIRAFHS